MFKRLKLTILLKNTYLKISEFKFNLNQMQFNKLFVFNILQVTEDI